jgi:ADP-heptose:LPS heptosyltransferase
MLPDVIRTPNHLGDLIMALPALAAAPEADLVVARWLVPIAGMLRRNGAVIPLDRGSRGLLAAVRTLRKRTYDFGVLLPPSFSSALVFRLGGVRRVRGTATDKRRLLLSDSVPVERIRNRHRTVVYRYLVTGDIHAAASDAGADAWPQEIHAAWSTSGAGAHVTDLPAAQPDLGRIPLIPPRLPVPAQALERWEAELRRVGGTTSRATVGVFPGSNAPSRRWNAERFAAVARALAEQGAQVAVFGAAGERALTAEVAGTWALDLGGRTDLPVLAAALSTCDILLTNDSGPMHLAAAVGTRTLVVSGPADTNEMAPGGSGHVYLQRLDLPCVPCVRNECPRRGAGYILPEAERECLRLIEVPEVLLACHRMRAAAP